MMFSDLLKKQFSVSSADRFKENPHMVQWSVARASRLGFKVSNTTPHKVHTVSRYCVLQSEKGRKSRNTEETSSRGIFIDSRRDFRETHNPVSKISVLFRLYNAMQIVASPSSIHHHHHNHRIIISTFVSLLAFTTRLHNYLLSPLDMMTGIWTKIPTIFLIVRYVIPIVLVDDQFTSLNESPPYLKEDPYPCNLFIDVYPC